MLYQPVRSKQFKHGLGKSGGNGYASWVGMRARCYSPENKDYPYYGGRGIKVCDRWMDDNNGYLNFIRDLGNRPSSKHSIDRIDVNGDYCPENCRWATTTEQSNNRGDYNRKITYKGETKTLSQWSKSIGIRRVTLRARLDICNWTVEKAFTTPITKKYVSPYQY